MTLYKKISCTKSSFCRAVVRIQIVGACMLGVAACGDTLVYGERTGFNLSVEVGQDPATPVNVNIGLRRTVVSVVPPIDSEPGEDGQPHPNGEAVSMISGFELTDQPRQNPLDPDLQIRSQFASGEAAVLVSGNPDVVRAIADTNFKRSADFASLATRNRVKKLLDETETLQNQAIINLATSPPVDDPDVDRLIEQLDPNDRRASDPAVALRMLKTRISYRKDDPSILKAWEAAVAGAPKK